MRLRSPASTEALDDNVKPIGIPGEAAWPSGKADEYYFVTARAAAAPAVSCQSIVLHAYRACAGQAQLPECTQPGLFHYYDYYLYFKSSSGVLGALRKRCHAER